MATGIIYGATSGIIRRYVRADDARSLSLHLGEGETMIVVDDADLVDARKHVSEVAKAMVETVRGKPAESARCVVIDNAKAEIEQVIMADPSLDPLLDRRLDAKTLYQHAEAAPGWTIDARGEFVKPVEPVIPEKPDDPRGKPEAAAAVKP